MRWFMLATLVGLAASAAVIKIKPEDAQNFLTNENALLADALNKITTASWALESDITIEHETALEIATREYDVFKKDQSKRAAAMDYSALEPALKRQFEKMIVIGTSALEEEDGKTYQKAVIDMITIYSTAQVTVGDKQNLQLEPHLTKIFAESRNADELRESWYKWRDATGKKMREDYVKYFTLGNKAATLNKLHGKEFKTFDDLWMFVWESTDIKEQVTTLMTELNEFYVKIHAYVRYHLQKRYPFEMPADGTIPAHLLGNMWAQDWGNLLSTVPEMNPHNDVKPIDEQVNAKLKSWTVRQMFDASDDFFKGLGMDPMTNSFWKNSILEKPTDKEMVCHASAWDFYKTDDYRIKQCTDKTLRNLQTVHHEMGHIQYFMEYSKQPTVYRDGGNPGFHEAIGDLIALSVVTPAHLKKIGLLDDMDAEVINKINLNYQMKMALEKVAFLPFSFVMDKWRWEVFSNQDGAQSKMNQRWWELRLAHQGVSPPVLRSEKDFDPGAKYHVPASVEYVRYFVSHVLQFQFFDKMCSFVGNFTADDLYTCDFDGNTDAGEALMKLLKAGSSDSWEKILKDFISTDKMSLDGLKKYFGPLNKYLDDFMKTNNINPGWNADVKNYIKSENTAFLDVANREYRDWSNKIGLASWAQSSNITTENTEALKDLTAKYAVWRKDLGERAKGYNFAGEGADVYERRQFEKFAVYGTSALSPEDGAVFNDASLRMKTIYSEAYVEIDGEILELEPGLVDLMATSSNADKLKQAWYKWRDATGVKMRDDYINFYKLGNKAAELNSVSGQEFKTFDALWMFEWESPDLKEQVDTLMSELNPLYQQIHAYVRDHLAKAYPNETMPDDGTIPAHMVGNMWAQQWGNLLNVIPAMNPHDDVEPIDTVVNKALEAKDEKWMFELSEQFFAGLTMDNMTQKFWENSIIVKPTDRPLTCHASAWDFYDVELDDFRIKQCTEKTMSDLVTVHHEMGHIQYYMNYKVKEPIYRRGANPGFHEAIGDLIALSVSTPGHLEKVQLFTPPANPDDLKKVNLNYQMKMALDKIAFLPFSYVMDKWRWDVFGGGKDMELNMNRHWWELRLEHQGISPPLKRSEKDFDPGAKYHIPANVEYVRYFVSHVLQFQFFEKMCSYVSKDFDENTLYTCDFDGNVEAGAALKKMLVHGSSDQWPAILEEFTGGKKMTLESLNKYFGPLRKFLKDYIEKNNVKVGWTVDVDKYMEDPKVDVSPTPTQSSTTSFPVDPESSSTSSPVDPDSSSTSTPVDPESSSTSSPVEQESTITPAPTESSTSPAPTGGSSTSLFIMPALTIGMVVLSMIFM